MIRVGQKNLFLKYQGGSRKDDTFICTEHCEQSE